MEDYHVLALNTSRLGEGVINGTLGNDDSTLGSLWNLVPDSIQNDVSEAAGVVTEKLGIEVGFLPFSSHIPKPPLTYLIRTSTLRTSSTTATVNTRPPKRPMPPSPPRTSPKT